MFLCRDENLINLALLSGAQNDVGESKRAKLECVPRGGVKLQEAQFSKAHIARHN